MKTTPFQQVKANFGDKAKLVSSVQSLATEALWLDRVNPAKGLAQVSNTKLLRLHAALTRAKEQFGSREGLVNAVLGLVKRGKDDGYKARLSTYPVPRLLDLHDSLSKQGSASTPAKAEAAKRKARSKKAKLKAAA
ncbi:MAG TPA: hypothetical protein VNN80_21355 [Polyangiaceae bacterium]|nr:hypothetical protein [Polyangiaceae bacterium]